MGEPHVPADGNERPRLSCGQPVPVETLDLGMREYDCPCGESHAVVMDVHPISRWVPEDVESILVAAIDADDEYGTFSTIHVMGMVLEEYPEKVTALDVSENDSLGSVLVWMTAFDARRLHEVIVELLVELMDHAMSHASEEDDREAFREQLSSFDVTEFVDSYRAQRDFDGAADRPV